MILMDYEISDEINKISTHNTNGSKTDYYNIPDWVFDVDDIAEYLDLRGDEFNCLKAIFGIAIARKTGIPRHSGSDMQRDSKKLLHYAKRINKRINQPKGENNK